MKRMTKSERRGHILASLSIAEDFPEGAFWGFMQERGIEADELPNWDEAKKCYVWPDGEESRP